MYSSSLVLFVRAVENFAITRFENLYIYVSILSIYLSIYTHSIYLYLSIYLSTYLYLSIYLSIYYTVEFLRSLNAVSNATTVLEYDVEDCFLNTPQAKVRPAVEHWLAALRATSRRAACFAISKDSRKLDRVGASNCLHFWDLTFDVVLAVIDWEINSNLDFVVQGLDGALVALVQHKGLPIGGCLSAGLVELVALHMEATKQWPPQLLHCLAARYRDNMFVCTASPWSQEQIMELCPLLSDILEMPVKYEGSGSVKRFLEMRITLMPNSPVKAVLAFRTDDDRQGESNDVEAWPPWADPRTRTLLKGLLMGLASKLVHYHVDGVAGLPASIRGAVRFLRGRHYPTRAWMRPFALALLHRGVPARCLPKCLRKTIRSA